MTDLLKNAIKEEMAREIADDLRGGSNEQKAYRVDTDKLKKLFESCKIELDGSTLTFEVPIEYHDNGVVKKSYVLEFDAVEEPAQADEMPDGFTFIGTRSIEEQPDGRGVINLGSADDYDQEETDSQLKDSVSYFMRKEMGGERALYEILGVVGELFTEMAAFSKREYSDIETARSFSESAENCEIVRDVIANRNSK